MPVVSIGGLTYAVVRGTSSTTNVCALIWAITAGNDVNWQPGPTAATTAAEALPVSARFNSSAPHTRRDASRQRIITTPNQRIGQRPVCNKYELPCRGAPIRRRETQNRHAARRELQKKTGRHKRRPARARST